MYLSHNIEQIPKILLTDISLIKRIGGSKKKSFLLILKLSH